MARTLMARFGLALETLTNNPIAAYIIVFWIIAGDFHYLRNNFSLPVNYRSLTHVVGGQITQY